MLLFGLISFLFKYLCVCFGYFIIIYYVDIVDMREISFFLLNSLYREGRGDYISLSFYESYY